MLHEGTLYERLRVSMLASQPAIWLQSHEPEEAMLTLLQLVVDHDPDWEIAIWDVVRGLRNPTQPIANDKKGPATITQSNSALSAISSQLAIAEERARNFHNDDVQPKDRKRMILVLRNGHREIVNNGAGQKEVMMQIQNFIPLGKAYNCCLIVMTFPGIEPPVELAEQFWVLDHDLPTREELKNILLELIAADEGEYETPSEEDMSRVIDATKGLTRSQAENVFTLSLLQYQKLVPSFLWKVKADLLNRRGLLQLHLGEETFESLGGLGALKSFCKRALAPGKPEHVRARAVLLLGVPGTGKSAFSKALGNEMQRPTMTLDIGRLMGSLVGETEERTREALRVVDAMEPCLLFIDEIEKALGGGGDHEHETSARMKGSLLSWMNDHRSDVMFICTANDISKLPAEFLRAERFDAIFFLDLPAREQKDQIWAIYEKMFNIEKQPRPDDAEWTGAEIRACCRLSALLDQPLVEAANYVVPVIVTAREQIDKLRTWADNRCLDAEHGGFYFKNRKSSDAAGSFSGAPTKRIRRRLEK